MNLWRHDKWYQSQGAKLRPSEQIINSVVMCTKKELKDN